MCLQDARIAAKLGRAVFVTHGMSVYTAHAHALQQVATLMLNDPITRPAILADMGHDTTAVEDLGVQTVAQQFRFKAEATCVPTPRDCALSPCLPITRCLTHTACVWVQRCWIYISRCIYA